MADEELRATVTLDAQSFSIGVGEIVARLQALEKSVESVGDKLTNHLEKGLGRANKSLEGLSLAQASQQLEQFGQKAAAAFAGIVTPAVSFETAMNSVNTVAKLGDKDLAALSEQMRTLGKDIGISIKPTEAAAAQYDILSAGFTNTADATEVLTQAAIASRGGLTTTAAAADLLTSALNSYGLGADQAKRVNDALFIGVEKGKLRFEDFVAGLGSVAPAAAANGVSIEELSAAMAALTAAGQQPARAFTGLNAAIVQLSSPTNEARKAAKGLGIDLDSAGFKGLSLVEKLQLLATTAGENKSALRQVLGDVNALGVAYSLTGNGAKTYADALAATQGPSNAAANAAKINEKGVEAAQRRFEAAAEAFSIGATKVILPALESIVESGASALEFFDSMPESLKEGIVIFAGIAGAVGTLGASVGGLLLGLKGLTVALGIQVPAAATATTAALGETTLAANAAGSGITRFLAIAGRIGVIGLVGTALVGLATYYVEVGKAAQKAADDAVNAAGKMSRAASVSTGAITSTPVDQLQAQGVGAEDVRNRIRPLRDAARNTAEKLTEVDKALEEQKRIGPGATKRIADLQAEKDSLIEASKKFEARIAELVAIEQKIGERAREVTNDQTGGIGKGAGAGLAGVPAEQDLKELKKQALFEIETGKLVGEARIQALQAYIAKYQLVGDEARHIEREIFQERKKLQEASETARKKAVEDEKADALQAIDISKASHAQKIQQFRDLLTKYKDDADFRRNILRQIAQEEAAADKDREDRQQKAREAAKKAQEEAKEKSSEERTARGDAISLRQDAISQQLGKEEAKGTKQSLSAIQVLLAEKQRLTEESIRLQLAEQLANTKSEEAKVQLARNAEERIRQEFVKTGEEFKRIKDEQVAKAKQAEEAMKPKKAGASTEFTGATLTPEQLAEQMAARFGGGAGNDEFAARRQATLDAQQKARDANIASIGATPVSAAVAALNAEKEKARAEALVAIEAARRSGGFAGPTVAGQNLRDLRPENLSALFGSSQRPPTPFVPTDLASKIAASTKTVSGIIQKIPAATTPPTETLKHSLDLNITVTTPQGTETQRTTLPGVGPPGSGGGGSVSFSPRGRA